MSTVTLAEAGKLYQDPLIQGLIENVITVNPFYEVFPFLPINGNAVLYNRENVLGDVQNLAVGGTITAKTPATFTQVSSALTTIIGDAEVNGLINATMNTTNNQKAIQVASKAKSAGRQYQNQMITGDGIGANIDGLLSLLTAAQTVGTGVNGGNLSFLFLDELIDLVTDKDGVVDYIMMHSRTIRSYYALLRALGGASIDEVVKLPSGKKVPAYRNIPIFRNDWLPINQVKGGSGAVCSTIFAGTFDDGSMKHGIAGINASTQMGFEVKEVGEKETQDESITRVVWYTGLANFSELGLAGADGILN